MRGSAAQMARKFSGQWFKRFAPIVRRARPSAWHTSRESLHVLPKTICVARRRIDVRPGMNDDIATATNADILIKILNVPLLPKLGENLKELPLDWRRMVDSTREH